MSTINTEVIGLAFIMSMIVSLYAGLLWYLLGGR